MSSMISPSVITRETDLSQVVAFEGSSKICFGGNFTRGRIGTFTNVDSVSTLRDIFGGPNKKNYNDWYQVFNALQYTNSVLVSRAANLDGDLKEIKSVTYLQEDHKQNPLKDKRNITLYQTNEKEVTVERTDIFQVNQKINFGENPEVFKVKYTRDDMVSVMVKDDTDPNGVLLKAEERDVTIITLDERPTIEADTAYIYVLTDVEQPEGNRICLKGSAGLKMGDIIGLTDSNIDPLFRVRSAEAVNINGIVYTNVIYVGKDDDSQVVTATEGAKIYKLERTQTACNEVSSQDEVFDIERLDLAEHTVPNYDVFDEMQKSLPFVNETAKLKFFARTPGEWGNLIEIAIANPEDFEKGKNAREGIALDSLFEYYPTAGQMGLMVFYKNELVETFTVSLDETAKDNLNNSLYIENVVNKKSNYILVNVNEANTVDKIPSYLDSKVISLYAGSDSEPGRDDIEEAYTVFENIEEVEVDIIMANELAPKAAAELAEKRKDCVAYIAAPKEICVGLKATEATRKHLEWRKSLNLNTSYVAIFSNYKYQYSSDLDKSIWINLAGDICGITAKVNFENGSHWASAGLNRGVIKNCEKLANSFSLSMRDDLYKNQINPIVTFPNQGSVIWG